MHRSALLLWLAHPACLTSSSEFQAMLSEMLDADADGYVNDAWVEEGGDDCDDFDALVFPGAPEICTGKDNDCDGYIDEGLSDWEGWYPDVDGDGYGDMHAPLERCPVPEHAVDNGLDCDDGNGAFNPEATDLANDGQDQNCDGVDGEDEDGDGAASVASGGDDCDDANPEVSPLVEEEPYNGVDDDCDASTPDDDVDGDGFIRADDCDDEDWRVYPGATEICGDGVINNCYDSPEEAWERCGLEDGHVDDITNAQLVGASAHDRIGRYIRPLGDLTGDGYPEFGVGVLRLFDGEYDLYIESSWGNGRTVGERGLHLTATNINTYTGRWFDGSGDVNADGVDDLLALVRAPGDTSRLTEFGLFLGPISASTLDITPAVLLLSAEVEDDIYGDIDASGEVTGDGVNDWLLGASFLTDSATSRGGAWLVPGQAQGDVLLQDAGVKLLLGSYADVLEGPFAHVGDQNGDGIGDVALVASRDDLGGEDSGAVYVLYGPFAEDRDANDADLVVIGPHEHAYFADSIVGADDWSGDGVDDLLIGASLTDSTSLFGAAFAFPGGTVGVYQADDAPLVINGGESGDRVGKSVALLPDISADGRAELIVGAPGHDEPSTDAGLVGVFVSATSGALEITDADTLIEASPGDELGTSISLLPGYGIDGFAEFAVSAPGYSDTYTDQGAVFLINGAGP